MYLLNYGGHRVYSIDHLCVRGEVELKHTHSLRHLSTKYLKDVLSSKVLLLHMFLPTLPCPGQLISLCDWCGLHRAERGRNQSVRSATAALFCVKTTYLFALIHLLRCDLLVQGEQEGLIHHLQPCSTKWKPSMMRQLLYILFIHLA